ncbi:MAG TPA: EAL domain-containing protein [bacterium]
MLPLTARPSLRRRLLRGMRVAVGLSIAVIGLVELLGLLTYLAAFGDRLPPGASAIVAVAAWARLGLEVALPIILALALYAVLGGAAREVTTWAGEARDAIERMVGGAADARVPDAPVRELNELTDAANRLASQIRSPSAESLPQELHDPLTGLPTRPLFVELLDKALARSHRSGRSMALLVLDLDDFKLINESLGYERGDQFLATVADRLRGVTRRGDLVGRTGGDEFSILAEYLEQPEDVNRIADRLLEQIAAPVGLGGEEVFTTASIGMVVATEWREGADALVRDAGLAMKQAKSGGKARYELFRRTTKSRSVEELRIRTDLRRAFERGEISVRFQPVVDLQSGEIREIASSLLWDHPRRGPIPAAEFLPVAEESGLLERFESRLLEDALREASAWWQESPRAPYRVSVPLSGKRFTRAALIAEITRLLDDAGIPAEALKIEIAEGAVVGGEVTTATLHTLKHMGVELGLTDFGMGRASLDHLKRYPIDSVTVSEALVQKIAHDSEDLAILRAIVGIAKTLKLTVISGGIERAEQVEALRAAGCDRGQGNYFYRPLLARDLREVLAAGPRWRPRSRLSISRN